MVLVLSVYLFLILIPLSSGLNNTTSLVTTSPGYVVQSHVGTTRSTTMTSQGIVASLTSNQAGSSVLTLNNLQSSSLVQSLATVDKGSTIVNTGGNLSSIKQSTTLTFKHSIVSAMPQQSSSIIKTESHSQTVTIVKKGIFLTTSAKQSVSVQNNNPLTKVSMSTSLTTKTPGKSFSAVTSQSSRSKVMSKVTPTPGVWHPSSLSVMLISTQTMQNSTASQALQNTSSTTVIPPSLPSVMLNRNSSSTMQKQTSMSVLLLNSTSTIGMLTPTSNTVMSTSVLITPTLNSTALISTSLSVMPTSTPESVMPILPSTSAVTSMSVMPTSTLESVMPILPSTSVVMLNSTSVIKSVAISPSVVKSMSTSEHSTLTHQSFIETYTMSVSSVILVPVSPSSSNYKPAMSSTATAIKPNCSSNNSLSCANLQPSTAVQSISRNNSVSHGASTLTSYSSSSVSADIPTSGSSAATVQYHTTRGSNSQDKESTDTTLIVGLTVGLSLAMVIVIVIIVYYRRKRSSYQYNVFYDEQNIVMQPFDFSK